LETPLLEPTADPSFVAQILVIEVAFEESSFSWDHNRRHEAESWHERYQQPEIIQPNGQSEYLLESEARLAASALGLDPGMGILHTDTTARDSLACDLMEPVRPQVDAYVLDWITRQFLKRDWFFEQRNGNRRLMATLAEKLSETALIWPRAVAPIAEWLAQVLWNSARKSSSAETILPTRLTQRRRSEGRGNEFAVRVRSEPRQKKICEVCGAEGVKNHYCKSCAVEVSRQTMANIALMGHSKPKTQLTTARISKRLSDHAVATTWWSPSSLPVWLTEEFYFQKIQPELRAKKVRELADAMQVSKPYAALVRSGPRRPQPRHWQALAGLAGVSRLH
jgi:hypothetical protein